MSISIYPEPALFQAMAEKEHCIFCDCPTIYWSNPKYNRPVCIVCAALYTESQIQEAPFNY